MLNVSRNVSRTGIVNTTTLNKLVDEGLVVRKTRGNDLRIFSYSSKVQNWTEELRETAGLVLNEKDEIVTLPFRKLDNYRENGAKLPKNTVVKMVERKGDFLAACSLYKEEVLVSTVDSLQDSRVKLAKEKIDLDVAKAGLVGLHEALLLKGTMLFGVTQEEVYLVGFRCFESGMLVSEEVLDRIAYACNMEAGKEVFKRPWHTYCSFKQALKKARDTNKKYVVYKKGSEKALKIGG